MQPRTRSLLLRAELDKLHTAQQFVRDQAGRMNVPDSFHGHLELVIEELFVNIVNHSSSSGKDEVEIQCQLQTGLEDRQGVFCLSIRDWGPPFNPLQSEDPSLEADLEKRPIGGLGIFLTKQMVDSCSYLRDGKSNLFQVTLPILIGCDDSS